MVVGASLAITEETLNSKLYQETLQKNDGHIILNKENCPNT